MIDILHLIDTGRIGGPGKTIINSARYIDRRRFRVHVCSFTSLDAARNEFARAVIDAGIPFLALEEVRRIDLAHLRQIRSYIKANGIRILHAHGYRSDVFSWMATRSTNVALVTTHHGWIRNNWRQTVFTHFAARLSARFDGVQVVSHKLLDELPKRLLSSGRVEVVHNGVVLQDYAAVGARARQRQLLGVTNHETLLGVVGRLSEEKGCREMLDAFQMVLARHADVRLVLVGEGPLEAALREQLASRNLQARVQITPHQGDVRPIYEAIDVLVCPSRTEGLSNVIMEAMAYARPIVATKVGGNGELVEDGETGLLVAPQNVEALASGISRLVSEPRLRERLGSAGQVRVRAVFSFEARMRREERFYDRVLAPDSAGPAT